MLRPPVAGHLNVKALLLRPAVMFICSLTFAERQAQASAFTMGSPLYLAGSALHACNSHRAPLVRSGWLNHGSSTSLRLRSKLPGRMQMSGGAVAETEAPPVYVKTWLEKEVKDALQRAYGDEAGDANPMVTAATKPEFGDYQCNAAMGLSKKLKAKPRDIAEKLLAELAPKIESTFEQPEIAGPGFINLKFKSGFISARLEQMLQDEKRLAVPPASKAQRIVIDFSSPNIAKEMHVGHLRSTIIGDSLARLAEFQGHDVLRLNHVGDWGTQFGMLITHLKDQGFSAEKGLEDLAIGDLVDFYREAKKRFDESEEFQDLSRKEVVKLQAGDEVSLSGWKLLCEASRKEFQTIYDTLQVSLEERGESFYNPMLADVCQDLSSAKLLEESEGAQVVFLENKANKDKDKTPFLIRKTDGGFLYSTTDLAAIRHRVGTEKAERIIYVTDAGQSSHFSQVFQVAQRAGWVPETLSLEHVPFGLVQGEDGKKFKTRSGETVKLKDLLDEAVRIAREDMKGRVEEEGGEWTEANEETAKVVGIAAVKYADLSMNRESNYRFSYKKMLSLSGNTAPYMLYAFARINGIRNKLGEAVKTDSSISLSHPSELLLARHLLTLPELLQEVEGSLYPNRLCDYIFELSQRFNQFYENCPVAKAPTEAEKESRAALCVVTANTLKLVLGLLGIQTVERL